MAGGAALGACAQCLSLPLSHALLGRVGQWAGASWATGHSYGHTLVLFSCAGGSMDLPLVALCTIGGSPCAFGGAAALFLRWHALHVEQPCLHDQAY